MSHEKLTKENLLWRTTRETIRFYTSRTVVTIIFKEPEPSIQLYSTNHLFLCIIHQGTRIDC